MHGPTDNPAGEQIKDRNQIQPTLSCEHASGIGGPYLIKPLRGETSEPIRGNGSAVAAVSGSGSILRALPSVESLLAHEPGDAVASSWTTQRMRQSWAAVSLATASKFLSDALAQADVFQLARSKLAAPLFPVVVTAA